MIPEINEKNMEMVAKAYIDTLRWSEVYDEAVCNIINWYKQDPQSYVDDWKRYVDGQY